MRMIIVFGSINMDVLMRMKDFPQAGETILSPSYEMMAGGKGANQALACARGGVKTALVGKVGDDAMGTKILNGLRRNEVMTSGVGISDYLPTGMAFVNTNAAGENQIIVASGANSDATAAQVPDEVLRPGSFVLLQMEVPMQENYTVMERAKKLGSKVVLNLAPAFRLPQKALELVDVLIVNELEARMIADVIGIGANQDLMLIAKALSSVGGLDCIVTLGSKGAVAISPNGTGWRVPAMELKEVVDTTGAGDCFCGTLTAALHDKVALGSAMRRASVAASLSCMKKGAQESYPYSADIEEVLAAGFPQAQAI
ncbi:MAG: ribokinase [Micavibrio aeruginosavorus]|uniref:Ribokinase n=1 Tax=Micavibrio aeruginosavorus TaxID=349221 RepID=A0A2W5MSQ3_9BACT|nr:MAG: ribokinase [Micavibrio aeruginosavorus]